MVAAGSKEENLAAFAKSCGFKGFDVLINDILALDCYAKSCPGFSTASALFAHNDLAGWEPWKRLVLEKYKGEVGTLASDALNDFINRETRGELINVIKEAELAGGVLALVSCLYFKGKWANPFYTRVIQEGETFHCFGKKKQRRDLMIKKCRMKYVADGTVQMVVLPYASPEEGPRWKAGIILPRDRGFEAMEDVLVTFRNSPNVLRNFLLGFGALGQKASPSSHSMRIHLFLPRFTLKLKLELIHALTKVGLKPSFSPSNGVLPLSKDAPLVISHASHNVFLEVDGEGAEMTSISTGEMT